MSADTVPTVPFSQVIDAVATRMGWEPARLQANQAAALTVYLNAAMETVWNFADWPEAMVSLLLPVTDNLIPWQASPINTRIPTSQVSTNGLFLTNLSGWTNTSLFFWLASGSIQAFTADIYSGIPAFQQTITGLTTGTTYRATAVIESLTTGQDSLVDIQGTVRLKVDHNGLVYQSAAVSVAGVLTFDFKAEAATAVLSLPMTGTDAEGIIVVLSQVTLHATAIILTAPRPPIDMVRGVFGEDPLSADAPVIYPYRLGPGCLHLTGDARDAAEAWVLYRPLCPAFTSSLYSGSTVYQSGGLNALAYDTTSGHVYRALSLTPFSGQAVTNTAYWEPAGVPARFKEALVKLATADALEEQDQYAKASRLRGQAMDWMENAALTHYHQSGQTKNYRSLVAA
jgi:hypothetical protein